MSEAPPLVPSHKAHRTVFIVVDDFGRLGRVYRETEETACDASTVVEDMIRGEYHRPVRVVAFNTDEGWSRDASREVAALVARSAEEQQRQLGRSTLDFLEHYLDSATIAAILYS
jgi:hypothetical protein